MNWSKSRRTRRSGFYARRRNRRNWWPLILFMFVVGFFFWAVFQLFLLLFSNVRTETIAGKLTDLKGRTEFLIKEGENWSPAFADLDFVEGDSIRTSGNAQVTLKFLDTNSITLDENTELEITKLTQNSSGKRQAHFELKKGQAWAFIDEKAFNEHKDSLMMMETDRLKINVRGTIFNLAKTESADLVNLFKGKVDVDVYGESIDVVMNTKVGVGQSLRVDDTTYDLLEQKADLLKSVDREFVESDWHVANLEKYFPDEATDIRKDLERQKLLEEAQNKILAGEEIDDEDSIDALEVNDQINSPVVTSHVSGQTIAANETQLFLKGTAPAEAFQIQVNDYILQQFQTGDATWQYIAATNYETLKPGENVYKIIAITRDGQRSPATSIILNHDVPVVETPEVSNTTSAPAAVANFPVPVVTNPELFEVDPTATFQTAQSPLTFSGTVPAGTVWVEVNGFRLEKFAPGDTTFRYIANAAYSNMKVGENIYDIKIGGPNNAQSQTSIKIVYTPISDVQ